MSWVSRQGIGIGASPPRIEDERLVRGQGRYVENLDLGPCWHAAFVRSPHAHAEIVSMDTGTATSMPGVILVLTGGELLRSRVGALPFHEVVRREDGAPMQPPARYALAVDRVRFCGEAVALVIADSRRAALDAAEVIEVKWRPLPVVVSAREANAPSAPLIDAGAPGNVVGILRIGDPDATGAAFAGAHRVVRLSLTNQRLSANPMETRSVVAEYDTASGRLTLHTGNQAPHMARSQIADCLGLGESELRILVPDIGGGFGMKLVPYPEEVALLHAARLLKGRIRWKADRTEAFLSDTHGRDHETDAEMAFDAAGHILGLRLRVFANMGAYLSFFGITVATGSGNRVISGVYRIPTVDAEIRAMLTNTAPVGPYRGAGRPEAIYRIERLLDLAADEFGLSPVEIRRINLIPPEAIPYTANSGQIYESGNFPRLLDRAVSLADWDGFPARRAAAEARGLHYGRGICCHIDTTSGVRPFETARIEAQRDGRIAVYSGTQAMGQGLATVYASMVASCLGLPMEAIEIIQGDTDRVDDGVGSYGSRSLFIGGSAAVKAAQALLERLAPEAAFRLGRNSGEAIFTNGTFVAGERSIALRDLLAEFGPVSAQARHESKFVFPNGCYVAEVAVDPETGHVGVARFSGVDDVGTVIHPKIVHGQVQGSVAQGIAQALHESIIYDRSGQLLTASYMDYAVPRADMLPRFLVETDETSPSPTNPLGAKGAGEAGCLGAPPAIVSAVMDALRPFGIRHLDMPLSPLKIWTAINNQAA